MMHQLIQLIPYCKPNKKKLMREIMDYFILQTKVSCLPHHPIFCCLPKRLVRGGSIWLQ
jgi:hypothetical protein